MLVDWLGSFAFSWALLSIDRFIDIQGAKRVCCVVSFRHLDKIGYYRIRIHYCVEKVLARL